MTERESATPYIALLRGINVGGHRRLSMAELRELCVELGFANVRTHIQSGNVVFEADPESTGDLADDLSAAIGDEYGYDVPVVVRTRMAFREVVDAAPFGDDDVAVGDAGDAEDATIDAKRYVTFLHEEPSAERATALEARSDAGAKYVVDGTRVYTLVEPGAAGGRRFSNNWVERELGVSATTRNWAVTRAIADLAAEG